MRIFVPVALALVLLPACSGDDEATSSGSAASSGSGGGGQGGGGACAPGETRACYSGPMGTEDVGVCHGGTQSCEGGTFGACTGEIVPTVEDCASPDDESCDGAGCGEVLWARRVGEYAPIVKGLPDGDIVIAGELDEVLLGMGAQRTWGWARLGPDGAVKLTKTFVSEPESGSGMGALAVDSKGDVVVFGEIYNGGSVDFGTGTIVPPVPGETTLYIAKYAAAGDLAWAKPIQVKSGDPFGAALAESGAVAVTGSFTDAFDAGNGPVTGPQGMSATFIIDYSAAGDVVKTVVVDYGGISQVAFDATGALTYMGADVRRYDANTDMVCTGVVPSRFWSLGLTAGGSGAALGEDVSTKDVDLRAFGTDCMETWTKSFADPAYQGFGALAVGPADALFFAFASGGPIDLGGGPVPVLGTGTQDPIVARFSPDGTHVWSKSFGSTDDDYVRGMAVAGAYPVLSCQYMFAGPDLGMGALEPGGILVKIAP